MNKKIRKWIPLLILSSALCIANVSLAQVNWVGGAGNWDVATNWVGGIEPGPGTTAQINTNGSVVTIDSSGNEVTRLNLANNPTLSTATASLLIATNGALNITGTGNNALWIAQGSAQSPTATLTVRGSLTVNTNSSTHMSTFQNTNTTASSSLIIDGGTVSLGALRMGDGGVSTTIATTLTLSNGGQFSGTSITTGTGTNTFNLSTISTGIDVVDTSGAFTLGSGNNILNVDLSSYDTNSGTSMTLFSYGSRSGSWSSVTIDGLGLGSIALGTLTNYSFDTGLWQGDFVVSSGSLSLNNLTVVPEPSTWALLAFGAGIGALAIRRRGRRA